MRLIECTAADVPELAAMNKRLIDDEKSSNPMDLEQLRERMRGFLAGEYSAYFFAEGDEHIGYALVRNTAQPLYLRQFYIADAHRRRHCGTQAFRLLLERLGMDTIDVDVLPWNGPGLAFWKSCGFEETCVSMRYKTP